MKKLLLAGVALIALALVAIFAASELGGEVVILRTRDASGAERRTSLWVVEHEGFQYLRAGSRDSGWVARLREAPEVEVERGGKTARYRAVPAPELTPRIDALIAERYGLADRLIAVIRQPGKSLAVRLEPLP